MDINMNIDTIEKILKDALTESKKRLKKLEEKYNAAIIEQYKDCLNQDIKKEEELINSIENGLNNIKEYRVDRLKNVIDEHKKLKNNYEFVNKLNNFESAVIYMLLYLHFENMAILHSCVGDKTASEIQKTYEDNINKVFELFFNSKII